MPITITLPKFKMSQFSKKVITTMTFLWFVGAFVGFYIIFAQGYGLEAVLSYIGMPMSGGIVGYMIKSGLENQGMGKANVESAGVTTDGPSNE